MNCLLRMPKSILLLFVSFISLMAMSQDIVVTGKVTDKETGQPIEGATIKVKNHTSAAITNAEGNFSIRVPSTESVLTITSVGYLLYEDKAGNGPINISLSPSNAKLDEVIVVGYGTQKQRNITGSVASVDIKKLEDLPTASITEALRGQIPGLNVSGGSARPGVNASLSIRQQFGWGKDGSSALPLIIIDDVIQLDPSTGLPSLDQFNLLDPSEIESITVLRDASAAIYGSRASQGAIVVKTKRGKIGAPKISYSGKFEYNDAISHVKTMNAYEYGIFANRFGRASSWSNSSFFDSSELQQMKSLNYDWRNEAWKSAGAMQHSLNVSGGSDRATYFAGGSYYTQSANLGSQDYNKWTFRTGTDVEVVNNLKLTANLSANNFSVEKSFTKVSINDGGYGVNSEQNDYLALSHMPKYIPWQYNVNGVDQYVSPALGPNRIQTNPSGQNNIAGWNYFALLNNGSKTTSGNFSYNTNFSLQYDIPFVKGLSVRGSYGLSYVTNNTDQVQLPQLLAAANGTNASGTHLYSPATTWNVKENTRGARVSYSDEIGKIQQSNFFINYDNSFGLHNISALASVEKGQQNYQKKYVIYDNPLSGGYNGASTSAGDLNVSNSYVSRTEGGNLSYLGRVSYNYSNKYLFQFLFRADASTKFAPENYWGFFPSFSAGWVVSKENWFNDRLPWVDFLKLRASVGKTGNDNLKPWRWLQLYSYGADKGFGFGQNGGILRPGLQTDATPNPHVTWDKTIKQNYGVDITVLRNRLSLSVDRYLDHVSNMLTQMAGMVGVPVSVGGAFAEENYSSLTTWGTEISASWKDRIGKDFEYSIGLNYGTGDNRVTKYIPVPFHYPSDNEREQGYSTIFPAWGFLTWKETSGGDGLLRTDADIDAYWTYLTDLATKAGTTPSYFGNTDKSALKKGMLAYQDLAGDIDVDNRSIAGKNGRIEDNGQDFAKLRDKNRSHGVNTNLGFSWKNLSLSAQIATSWGGYNEIDFIKQGTSSNQIFWAHESFLTDMYDPVDNPNGKWPSLAYYDENGVSSDFWQISSFRSYVRSLVIGYTLPKGIANKVRMDNLRLSLAGFNLWDFHNPYPGKYRNMYDDPTVSYPTLRTWALGVSATF
jgi:TonB-linked SusC/RagA family outer membrane protein